MGNRKKSVYIVDFVLILVFVFIFYNIVKNQELVYKQNHVDNGILSITPVSLDNSKTVALDGMWKFYPDNLLTPEMIEKDIDNNKYESMYIDVPSDWKKVYKIKGKSIGDGYGTYYMEIQGLKEYKEELALELGNIYTCYKIWVNDKLISESGTIGTDKVSSKAQYKKGITSFYNREDKIKIVIQVSNFQHRSGGIWETIKLGNLENVIKYRDSIIIVELFLIGSFVFMGLYHIFIYNYLNEYKTALFLGLFCLICSLRLIVMGETIVFKIFPSISWELDQKIEYVTYYFGSATIVAYIFYLFPGYIKKWIREVSAILSSIFALIIIFLPARIYSNLNYIFQIYTLILCIYLIYIFTKVALDKVKGALLGIIGIMIFALCSFLDILYYNSVIYFGGGRLFAIGLFVFIFIQSIILSKMFSQSFKDNKVLASVNHQMYLSIKESNENLEIKIKDRTKELSEMMEKLNIYASTDQMTGF